MALWMVRAGRNGEYENVAIELHLAIIGWGELPDLTTYNCRDELAAVLESTYPHQKHETILNWASQLWAFVHQIEIGDLIVLRVTVNEAIALMRLEPYSILSHFHLYLTQSPEFKHSEEVDQQFQHRVRMTGNGFKRLGCTA